MTKRGEFCDALRALGDAEIPGFLTAHSGLPGPRGNLELLAAFGDVASADLILGLVGSDDEYLAASAAAALGRLVLEAAERADEIGALLHAQAQDARWRVREGVAMALQRLGDGDPARLRDVVRAWADDPDPLVQRAAIAGICEPRLLRDPRTAQCALDACRQATASLAARPASERRRAQVRVLRQGLGYCWSVAVAGSPDLGLPAFAALASSADADVGWIVRENRTKARLARLLDPAG
jgi:HEAT repeats